MLLRVNSDFLPLSVSDFRRHFYTMISIIASFLIGAAIMGWIMDQFESESPIVHIGESHNLSQAVNETKSQHVSFKEKMKEHGVIITPESRDYDNLLSQNRDIPIDDLL
jgi:hypothetical protein